MAGGPGGIAGGGQGKAIAAPKNQAFRPWNPGTAVDSGRATPAAFPAPPGESGVTRAVPPGSAAPPLIRGGGHPGEGGRKPRHGRRDGGSRVRSPLTQVFALAESEGWRGLPGFSDQKADRDRRPGRRSSRLAALCGLKKTVAPSGLHDRGSSPRGRRPVSLRDRARAPAPQPRRGRACPDRARPQGSLRGPKPSSDLRLRSLGVAGQSPGFKRGGRVSGSSPDRRPRAGGSPPPPPGHSG